MKSINKQNVFNIQNIEKVFLNKKRNLIFQNENDRFELDVTIQKTIQQTNFSNKNVLIGVAGSGKTFMIEKFIKSNPNKKFIILGLEELFEDNEHTLRTSESILKYSKWFTVQSYNNFYFKSLHTIKDSNFIVSYTEIFNKAVKEGVASLNPLIQFLEEKSKEGYTVILDEIRYYINGDDLTYENIKKKIFNNLQYDNFILTLQTPEDHSKIFLENKTIFDKIFFLSYPITHSYKILKDKDNDKIFNLEKGFLGRKYFLEGKIKTPLTYL